MDKKVFSYSEALKYGFKTTLDNLPLFIRLTLILLIVFLIPIATLGLLSAIILKSVYPGIFLSTFSKLFLGSVGSLVTLLALNYYNAGLLNIYLKLYDEKNASSGDLFINFGLSLKYLVVATIRNIFIILGFLLFIVPGIYLFLRYYFAKTLVIDRNTNIYNSFAESNKLTQGHKWHLFWFECLLNLLFIVFGFALHIVGVLSGIHELIIMLIASFIGFIVSIATVLARVYVYRKFMPKETVA